uniref:Roadblock/LAMTOR2 domain-containing protein n=1 Tax=Cyanistes caeruleus TaxID=156563 RepID=A0A8C0UEM9_CYACU
TTVIEEEKITLFSHLLLLGTVPFLSTTVQYSDVLHQLPMTANSTAKGIDPQNDPTCLRIRSEKHKIMITPVNISVRITVELYVFYSYFYSSDIELPQKMHFENKYMKI